MISEAILVEKLEGGKINSELFPLSLLSMMIEKLKLYL